jgi:glutaredoxin-related protein
MGICNFSKGNILGSKETSEEEAESQIQFEIKKNIVVVYGEAKSKKLTKIQELLKSVNINFVFNNLTKSDNHLLKELKRITGRSSSPYVFVTGKYYGGASEVEDGVKNHLLQKIINSKLESIGSKL